MFLGGGGEGGVMVCVLVFVHVCRAVCQIYAATKWQQ